MPTIVPGAVATILTAETDVRERIAMLGSAPGFAGAVLLRAIRPFRKRVVYVRWSDRVSAEAQDDGPALEAIDVRLKSAPRRPDGRVALATANQAVLVVRWEVEPDRCEALLTELQDFTDLFLPEAHGVISTAFHVSADRRVVAEYLQAESVWAMLILQFSLRMRRHQSKVDRLVTASNVGLYRVERVVQAHQGRDPISGLC